MDCKEQLALFEKNHFHIMYGVLPDSLNPEKQIKYVENYKKYFYDI